MGEKRCPIAAPPPKAEADLSAAERAQLAALKVGPESPVNAILVALAAVHNAPEWKEKRRDKVKSVRDGTQSYEIVWEQMPSRHCDKLAAKFTVTVPGLTLGSLEAVIGDDRSFSDAKSTMIYKYDTLVNENRVEYMYGRNVLLNRTCHRGPIFTVSSREMHVYLSYLNLLDAAQQRVLGLVPASARRAAAESGDAAAAERLRVLCQGGVDYLRFNKENGIDAAAAAPQPPLEVRKKHVLGSLHHYLVMGQEEVGGALTLTMIVDMDPAGSLPAKIVNMAMSEQLEKMKIIVGLCERAGPVECTVKPYENTRDFFPF